MKRKIDEATFIRAYDEYADEIFRYCAFRVYDRERAQDLMQDTFTRTWAYIEMGKEVEHLRAFLYKTAHNLCANEAVRSKSFSLDEMQEIAGFDPEDKQDVSPEQASEHSLLMKHVAALPEETQELLTLRYMNGLPVAEIAEMLGEAPNTISVRIHRAIKELQERMHAV
ncbi:sigma-70 family RNA polymerase sigma factor [Patescibacteria group bacterium]|nr:sigma-70 family RNA polymerase sigma factor [Patescibacteria group bacterium]MBU1500483.1 sigma-70 family RNA polymerase sigma factor [Patescibacteria group bacterium]MBU2080719.1 sigma-70 family RNA polymerase sigma factor [Patescibacteria group bacterium]MBU2123824.1 sigma-70 family RNA polymerase sigma factor [Patescibacteria group bacterium]MBU2194885.1 sigma-70 family RNA polymerase sigma factor [Patescibacteria group bacterium]